MYLLSIKIITTSDSFCICTIDYIYQDPLYIFFVICDASRLETHMVLTYNNEEYI